MEEQELLYRETKLMEPIFRMHRLIQPIDDHKATTLMAVVVQYITDHCRGAILTSKDVQRIIRAVLLKEDNGQWFAMYLRNELQVKIAGWMILLAADLPITLEELGELSEKFGAQLENQSCLDLTPAQVLDMMHQLVEPLSAELWERMELNHDYYLKELGELLGGIQ